MINARFMTRLVIMMQNRGLLVKRDLNASAKLNFSVGACTCSRTSPKQVRYREQPTTANMTAVMKYAWALPVPPKATSRIGMSILPTVVARLVPSVAVVNIFVRSVGSLVMAAGRLQ